MVLHSCTYESLGWELRPLLLFGLFTVPSTSFISRVNSTIEIDEHVEALRTSNALEILSQYPLCQQMLCIPNLASSCEVLNG